MNNKYCVKLSLILLLFMQMLFVGCADDDSTTSAIDPVAVESYNTELSASIAESKSLRDDSPYGTLKDQFPEESKTILNESIEYMESVLGYIADGKYVNPTAFKLSLLTAKADKAVVDFNATKRLIDYVAPTFELFIKGKDNGYIDFGTSADYNSTSDKTIEFQIKLDAAPYLPTRAGGIALLSTYTTGPSQGWMLDLDGNNFRSAFGRGGNAQAAPSGPAPQTTFNDWTHIALTYKWVVDDLTPDNGDGKGKGFGVGKTTMWVNIYINGVHWKFGNNGWPDGYMAGLGKMVAFAGLTNDPGIDHARGCNGSMKHLRIWNVIKSADEISQLAGGQILVDGTENDLIAGWKLDDKLENGEIPNLKSGGHNAVPRGEFEWVRP